MTLVKVQLTLKQKGTLDHIDVTLGGVRVPFQNGNSPVTTMQVSKGRPHMIRAEVDGQPGGSIQVSVKPGTPKIPISHLKSRIDVGQTSDVSMGEFTVPVSVNEEGEE